MKKYVSLLATLFFAFIISLYLYGTSMPDIFIIEAILVSAFFIAALIRRLLHVGKIRSKADSLYGCRFKYKNPALIFAVFSKSICLSGDDCGVELVIIFVRRRYARYHFESKNRIEVYVSGRESYRIGKTRYSVGRTVTQRLADSICFDTDSNAKILFILTKAPMDVTSSDKKANEYLGCGDAFFENCSVYTKKHFLRRL